ncbi:MAG: porin, partial [Mycobacterium sp.]
MKAGRVLVAVAARVAAALSGVLVLAAGLVGGAGSAQAALDNQMTLVDGGGRTMTIQQWDTFLDG